MNNFYIIANSNKKDHIWKTVEETQGYLKRHGAFCQVQDNDFKKDSGRYTDASLVSENVNCVITIGGDGTLIQAARDLADRRHPPDWNQSGASGVSDSGKTQRGYSGYGRCAAGEPVSD